MFLSFRKIGTVLAVAAIAASCDGPDHEVAYCNPAGQGPDWGGTAMHIDLGRGLVYGDDQSAQVDLFSVGEFVGLEGGLPILLFPKAVEPNAIRGDIIVRGVVFRVSPVAGSSDLWVITANPADPGSVQAPLRHSSVIYSTEDGVLLIGLSASIGEEVHAVNHVPCTNRTLRYDDLRRAAAAGALK